MKVREKLVRLDELSVSEKTRHIHIYVHGQNTRIKLVAYRHPHGEGKELDLTFDQLYSLIKERGV